MLKATKTSLPAFPTVLKMTCPNLPFLIVQICNLQWQGWDCYKVYLSAFKNTNMKKSLLLTIVTVSLSLGSFAQDKASDLKKLFKLMQTDKMIDGMMNNILPTLKQQARTQIQGADASKKFDRYMDFLMAETKELCKKLVDEEMVKIYDKHFTQEEVKDLIKFYESPTGKKILDVTPDITKDLMNSMMSTYMPEFQARVTKKLEQLK
jgi:hypothetical protein